MGILGIDKIRSMCDILYTKRVIALRKRCVR